MKKGISAHWLWLLLPVFIIGMVANALLTEPNVITETVTVEKEVLVEVPIEVIKEVSATGLDAIQDLYDNAQAIFEDNLYKIDEWDNEEYDLDEIDVEDYDNFNFIIDDFDDNEYTVTFEVDVEYDNDVNGKWFVEVSFDEDGDYDIDVNAIEDSNTK